MDSNFRPSTNVQQGKDEPLMRYLLGEQAYAPDDAFTGTNRPVPTDAQRDAAAAEYFRRTPFIDPNDDVFRVGRPYPQGPSHPSGPTSDMLQAMMDPTPDTSFAHQSDQAQFASALSALLSGQDPPKSPQQQALEQAGGGPIDQSLISRFFGVREP